MTPEQAIRKVQACLRLAGSSNPTESATALRQARALMDKYGLTEADAAAADVKVRRAPTGYRGGELPQSLIALASLIADGYRCRVIAERSRFLVIKNGLPTVEGKTELQFVGAGADPEIAAYAFTVLRRHLRRDKANHVARCRKRTSKERRSEEFAIGWVVAIRRLFPRADLPEGRTEAIELAIRQRSGTTETTSGKQLTKRGRSSDADREAGYTAGRRAQLHQGLAERQNALEVIA
ncbi:DUF2786 domain-containing protein [Xanthomonas nasturtii]|uniref:DUF2786 domain-containing protein n=1 Tax=Xanthomonas nasturtii TaxID=1843581 RepID=A0ABT0LMB2_9XANT|nr:DUF2786 domain-containing protein [Xanthomonas nasturtii]MCL1550486.1 DUF2786 domain-containing protein [Xanthomonas nasturtii]MCL1554724.1 DUF2786 domain-containing protein [Xanthomonas nasturtii]